MKFAKYLTAEAVPEWRIKYIDYKGLKKSLKAIRVHPSPSPEEKQALLQEKELATSPRTLQPEDLDNVDIANLEPGRRREWIDKLLGGDSIDGEPEFFDLLEADLVKIDNFYREREMYATETIAELKTQFNFLENLSRLSLASNLNIEAPRSTMTSRIKSKLKSTSSVSTPVVPPALGLDGIEYSRRNDVELDGEPFENLESIDEKVARRKLKKAFLEFYRMLELLKNYRILNHTGFGKIMKKFDKLTQKAFIDVYMKFINNSYFFASPMLDEIIRETENLFSNIVGDRRKAMQRLRLPNFKSQTFHGTVFRIGLYAGLALFPIISTIIQLIATPLKTASSITLLQIYGGMLIPILAMYLFALCIEIWRRHGVNYVFVFEFDPRSHLSVFQVTEFAGIVTVLFAGCFFMSFRGNDAGNPAQPIWVMVFFILVMVILIVPLPLFYIGARWWFLKSMGRILTSGFWRIEFRDFFLTDFFTSMGFMFLTVYLLGCTFSISNWYSGTDPGICTLARWPTAIFQALPLWWRFCQCIRRFFDSNYVHTHAVNAGKYLSALVVVLFSTGTRVTGEKLFLILWACFGVFATVYALSWDIFHDFGFKFKSENGYFLRNELAYEWKKFYRFALIWNVVLRFGWILLLSGVIESRILSFVLAIVEVFRRFVWALLRMENEHLNNCGRFRATKEIPLPFQSAMFKIKVEDSGNERDEPEVLVMSSLQSPSLHRRDTSAASFRTGSRAASIVTPENIEAEIH